MKTTILTFLCTILSLVSYAQQPLQLSGKVLSANGTPTDGYNLLLLSPADSSLRTGDFFFDPGFTITTDQLPVLLKVTSIGYKDTLFLVRSAIDKLPDIRLTSQDYALNEVVIKASQPLFTMRNDRMTLNVAGTALSESGSVVDVLQKAARVKVDESSISVLGVGNALIVVDGRELPGNQALEMIASSEIQKVDIITNPSAKYDAKGKAVIEIRTKKAQNQGVGAEVTTRLSKSEYWNPYAGIELTGKTSRLSLYGFYAFSPTKRLFTESYARDYTQETPPIYGLIDMESINQSTGNHRLRLSGDYRISDQHTVGLQLSGQFIDGENTKGEISRLYPSTDTHTTPASELISGQRIPFNRNYLTGTAYHSYQSSPSGMTLNSVFDKSRYDTDLQAHISEQGQTGILQKQNDVQTTIDITSFKSDAHIPLPYEWQLETGLKYSYIHNRSNTHFSSEGNTLRNIDYDYKENNGALYLLLSRTFGRLQAEGGARLEMSDNYATTDIVVQDTIDWHLFPSLALNYNLSRNWDLHFSYAMKISRPTFQDLNPAIDYIDSLTYFQGNPGLVPEIRHALTLQLSYLKMATLGISYTRKHNTLAWFIEQDATNPNLTRVTQQNINRSDVLSIDALLPYRNQWLSAYLSTGLIYTISNDRTAGVSNLKQPMWYAYSGLDFTLPYGFKLNTNIRYFTKGLENVFYFDPVFRMDAGLRKSFLSDKLTASLLWNDIFRTDDMHTYTTINNRTIDYNYYYDRSSITLSLSYRFSAQKSRYQSRSSISTESGRIKGLE